MDWKEFFRPTLSKIFVFLVIFVVFVPFIPYDTGIRCFREPCPSGTTGSVLMYLLFSHNLYIYASIKYYNLIIGLIASYLVSCVAVSIFSKIKKK